MSRSDILQYAVRRQVLFRHLGQLMVPLALATLPVLGAAVIGGSWGPAAVAAGVSAVTGGGGWALSRIRAPRDIQVNEAMVVVALAFLVAALALTGPFMAYGLHPLDAFFEAVSGITTTGLSVVPDAGAMPPDFLFIRSWSQWFGGLGFVTVSALLVTRRGRAAQRLREDRTPSAGAGAPDPVGGTRAVGRVVLVTYGILTAAGVVALLVSGTSPFSALVHTLSAVSTGGFSTQDASLGALGVSARGLVTLLTVAGALPLLLLHHAAANEPRALWRAPQPRLLVLLALVATGLVFLLSGVPEPGWPQRLGHAALMAFSAQTTSGFSSLEVAGLTAGSQAVLMGAMVVGGCSGSTAGGIKVWRALLAGILVRHTLLGTALPEHAVRSPHMGGEAVEAEEGTRALGLIVLFVGVAALSWLAFLAAGYEPMAALFDVISATGTVGLSTGITGPDLAPPLKLVLCADMLIGRLEIMAVLVLFAPATWIGRRRSAS